MIHVISGESGCGKTTLCVRLIESLKVHGLNVAGVLTTSRFANGEKIGMDVEDVRTGARQALAERAAEGKGTTNLSWKFHDDVLIWGTQVLYNATPCDLLVVDELGPLEMLHGKGWLAAIEILRSRDFCDALVVVRPSLLGNLLSRLQLETRVLHVTPINREELYHQVLRNLDPQLHVNSRT